MKKLFLLATAAFLFTGFAFSNQGGDGKKCAKVKECCKDSKDKKDCKDRKDCKKGMKDCKSMKQEDAKAIKTMVKEVPKAAAKA